MRGPESCRFDLRGFLNDATGGQFMPGVKERNAEIRGIGPGDVTRAIDNVANFGLGEIKPRRE